MKAMQRHRKEWHLSWKSIQSGSLDLDLHRELAVIEGVKCIFSSLLAAERPKAGPSPGLLRRSKCSQHALLRKL
jgi:hypothetical protein